MTFSISATRGEANLAGWLTKAAAAFRGTSAAAPQPFHIGCECGGHVSGLRIATHQKVICLACQQPILVLPASPYPAVKRLIADAPRKKSPAVVQSDEQSPREPQAPTARQTRGFGKSSRGGNASAKNAKEQPPGVSQSTTAASTAQLDLSPALLQEKQRRRNFRLVVCSILALIAVTGWSLRNRSQREQARLKIPLATEAGLIALHAGDFATAVRQLTVAVDGLETLHRTDAAAQAVRQAHREAVAAEGLSSVGLAELAQEYLSDTSEDRARRFQAESGQKWLIFDASLIGKRSAHALVFELDVPWAVGERPLQIQCDFPAMQRFAAEASSATPQRVIFAGQIEEWILPAGAMQPVIAKLRSKTAFLWCDKDSLRAVSGQSESPEVEQETRDLLSSQRRTEDTP